MQKDYEMSTVNHTIEVIDGVTIVRCSSPGLPLQLVGEIMSKAKKDEVLDTGLGGRIGALLVFGSKHALASYRATNPAICQAVESEIAAASQAYSGLQLDEIVAYLSGYDRGSSADSLLMATSGLTLQSKDDAVPHDTSDTGRCIRLFQACSVVRDNIHRARPLLSTWDKNLLDLFQEVVKGNSLDSDLFAPAIYNVSRFKYTSVK